MICRLVAGLLVLWLAGCAAPRSLTVGTLAWSESGLLNWKRGESSLTAEFELGADAGGNLRLMIHKTESLLEVVRSGNEWSATGPMAGLGWTGPRENAPLALAGWLTLVETLAYIQTAPDDVDAIVSGSVRARWDQTRADIITSETAEQFRVAWQ
ncbi:MAG: hypothetical protein ACOVMP_00245 [Chthoniobacterales bacterium]